MKTVLCPSCGASATNLKNCDFCGSLFVRAEQVGYAINNLFSEKLINNGDNNLIAEIEKNLHYQNTYDCDCFSTQVFRSKNDWLELKEPVDGVLSIFNSDFSLSPEHKGKRGSISVDISRQSLTNSEWQKFIVMPEFVLFDKVDADWYKMDFGQDIKGASFITTKILTEILDFDLNSAFYITNVDCIIDGNVDELKKWEQSQSLEVRTRIRKRSEHAPIEQNDTAIVKEKSGPCFIATATIGDFDHPTVLDLRSFRDEWILKKTWGKRFVNWYYKYGAIAAKFIVKSSLLKKISFVFIVKPLHIISKLLLKN
jgi:hypothetical protein